MAQIDVLLKLVNVWLSYYLQTKRVNFLKPCICS